jgi:hypothetical protein
MTQLFSNELQRLSQRTEGAFAEDCHGSTTPGGPPLMTTIFAVGVLWRCATAGRDLGWPLRQRRRCGGTIGRSGDAMPPLLGRVDLGQQHLDPRHSVVSTATLEHPKERPRVVVVNPARNAVYVGTTGDVGLTVIPL